MTHFNPRMSVTGIVVLMAMLLSVYAFGQRVKPSEIGETFDPSVPTARCAVQDVGEMQYSYGDYLVTIYESAGNISILPNRYGTEGTQKRYYVEPDFQIKRINGDPAIKLHDNGTGNMTLEIRIVPVIPPKNNLKEYIRHNGNFDVMEGSINPLCVYEYAVNYPGAKSSFDVNSPGGFSLDQEIVAKLEFNKTAGRVAYDDLMNGGSVEFSYRMAIKSSAEHLCYITYGDFVNSDAYRSYISPVKDNLIWAFQSYIVNHVARGEIATKCINEGSRDETNDKMLNRYMELIYQTHNIPFEEASSRLINLDGSRFESDVTRKLAIDAKNMTRNEWCNKYKRDFENLDQSIIDHFTKGGGGFSFLGFKINGSADKTTKEDILHKIHQILNTEDCGKSIIENSFKYEFDGERYEPKGIIAVDNILLKKEISLDYVMEEITPTQDFLLVNKQIR